MKTQINLTDSQCDLDRFSSREELWELLTGFDGIELMHCEEDTRQIIDPAMVVGYHMSFPQCWMDFWLGNRQRLQEEYDTLDKAWAYYGGSDPDLLVQAIRKEYARAMQFGAEYVVFHVSDARAFEEIRGQYYYSDAEVVEETCRLLNEALPEDEMDGPLLLLENLWQPGLKLTDPSMTKLLLEGVRYPWTGIMLDTGHLMHTNPSLRTQTEALAYIHRILDEHGSLCRYIHGIHLHQSLTGTVMRRYQKHPPEPAATYEERMTQLFTYVFQVDLHRPFACPGVLELIERIQPDYVTWEFISSSLEEHRRMLRRQRRIYR